MEPTLINVLSHEESEDETKAQLMDSLAREGYVQINVNELISLENERRTALGKEFLQYLSGGKVIPAEITVKLLKKVMYSGNGQDKYTLTSDFPTNID